MKATLSEGGINKLKLKNVPYEVHDAKLQGFLVRVQPSGVMTYYCQYRRGKRIKLGRVGVGGITLGRAKQKYHDIMSAERDGGYTPVKKSIGPDVSNLGEFLENEYEPWFKAHRKPPYKNLNNLVAFSQYHEKKLVDIDVRLIERWSSRQRIDGKKDSTIKRYLNSLHAVLSKAVEWGVIDAHPLLGMKRIKTDDIGRVRFLSADENKRLLSAIDDREEKRRQARDSGNKWRKERGLALYQDLREQAFTDYLKPIVLLAMNTGMRMGEIVGLLWSDVDLDNRILTVRGEISKSSKTRHIPLNSIVSDMLNEWRKQSSHDYVFNIGSFQKSWRSLVKSAQIDDFRFHDLRHDFASRLAMSGVDLRTIQELLGHANLNMTLRYAYLAPSHKASAVEKLSMYSGAML